MISIAADVARKKHQALPGDVAAPCPFGWPFGKAMKTLAMLAAVVSGLLVTSCAHPGERGHEFSIDHLNDSGAFRGSVRGHYSRENNSLRIHVDRWIVRFGVGDQPGRQLDDLYFELGVQDAGGYWSRGITSSRYKMDQVVRSDKDVVLKNLDFSMAVDAAVWTQKTWLVAVYETTDPSGQVGMNYGADKHYLFTNQEVRLSRQSIPVLQPAFDSQAQASYVTALKYWLDEHVDLASLQPGRQPTFFNQEVYALEKMNADWERNGRPGRTDPDMYAGLVARIVREGFLREYVWKYKQQPLWERPPDLRENEFDLWAEANLPNHVAPDFGYVYIPD